MTLGAQMSQELYYKLIIQAVWCMVLCICLHLRASWPQVGAFVDPQRARDTAAAACRKRLLKRQVSIQRSGSEAAQATAKDAGHSYCSCGYIHNIIHI